MACPIQIINFESGREIDRVRYRKKARTNEKVFDRMYGMMSGLIRASTLIYSFDFENEKLMRMAGEVSGIGYGKVKSINIGDELMNFGNNFHSNFGCTSIGRNGVIGQTMDLYDLELAVMREGNALYVTFPPYLALMGMNEDLAFCTNFLGSKVGRGTPVSQMRRKLLRYHKIDEAVEYLDKVKKANSANFLLSDGENIVDVETTRNGINIKREIKNRKSKFNAHTNHLILGDVREDYSCSRLRLAVKMLEDGKDLEEILDRDGISLQIVEGFGSIVKVIMDVKKKRFSYKDPRMSGYVSLSV